MQPDCLGSSPGLAPPGCIMPSKLAVALISPSIKWGNDNLLPLGRM